MINVKKFDEIQTIISQILKIDKKKILIDSNLIDDLKANSLDLFTLIFELEGKLNLYISNEDVGKIKTVSDILNLL